MRSINVLTLAVLSCLSGCGTVPIGPQSLDGDWQISSQYGVTCITISGGRAVTVDDGCNGSIEPVLSTADVGISGNRVIATLGVYLSSTATWVTVALDGEMQPDGTISGIQTLTIPNAAGLIQSSFIMNRM